MSPTSYQTAPSRDDYLFTFLVPETGIEPVRSFRDRRILSPVRLPVPPLRQLMAPRVGLEPTTYRLTAGCSTIELPRNVLSGSDLLSQTVSRQVPSALRGLTSVFGMGTGVSLSLLPPD